MWSWTTAIRFNENEDISILCDKKTPFIIVPNSRRYWTADPFLFEKDGKLYLFFEAFDISKRKGLLGYRTVNGNQFGDINIFYEHDSHLSFPFIYEDNGEIYVIPESAKSGELFRLKCVEFPDKWVKDSVILNETVVDSVRFDNNGTEFIITEKVDETHTYDRVDLFYYESGSLRECSNNPVKLDVTNARGAGAVSKIGDMLIRPAQDCGDSYGECLNLNELISISKDSFSERLLDKFTYRDIAVNENIKIDGIHTYNKLGSIEVIDLRIPGKFNLLYTLGFFKKLFDKLFNRR